MGTTGDDSDEMLLRSLVTADLAAAESGVEFVYRSLDRMQRRAGADDVVLVIDQPPLGRQVFRGSRLPIETRWANDIACHGAPGVHAIPDPIGEQIGESVLQLCVLALALDVARHESLHDPLTGLLNRRAFDEVLTNSCANAERYSWPFVLVLLDLDGFKKINDRLGHATGDSTLRAMGTELRHRLRVGDAAARVGGDEFALILPNVQESIVDELVSRIEQALHRGLPETGVTLSAGFASAPGDGHSPGDLYRLADNRLYQRKAK